MKKLLVTGSSGLIGSEVCIHFAQLGWEIHGVDNNQRANLSSLESAIIHVLTQGEEYYSKACRERAKKFYDKNAKYNDYFDSYETILKGNK